jgi:hypothetical protein
LHFFRSSSDISTVRASEKYASLFSQTTTRDDELVGRAKETQLPTFTTTLDDTSVDDGDSAEFSCQVSGSPEPLIEWLHNGEKISPSSSRFSAFFSGGRATLKISEVQPEDEGEYSCRASNSAGTESTKASLTVRY